MISPSEHTANSEKCDSAPLGVIDGSLWLQLCRFIQGQRIPQSEEDARDLTQEVFYHLLRTGALDRARRNAGSEAEFFAFLKKTAKNRLIKNWQKNQAQKRGGGYQPLSLDSPEGAWVLGTTPAPNLRRETAYLELEHIVAEGEATLSEEYRQHGRESLFELLKPFLCGDERSIGYEKLAHRSGMPAQSLRTALFRARRRFREIVRDSGYVTRN